jgi:nucleoid DNA-binding protein
MTSVFATLARNARTELQSWGAFERCKKAARCQKATSTMSETVGAAARPHIQKT